MNRLQIYNYYYIQKNYLIKYCHYNICYWIFKENIMHLINLQLLPALKSAKRIFGTRNRRDRL